VDVPRAASDTEISVDALEVWGRHGVLPEEKRLAQRFLVDVRLMVRSCPATLSDRLADTVDYGEVVAAVAQVVEMSSFELLERLARVLAEVVLERFPAVDSVWLRVTKAEPPISRRLGGVAVSLALSRGPRE
jgi:7,8-dihydroneopterin aldolase/epimerase/oxygenase